MMHAGVVSEYKLIVSVWKAIGMEEGSLDVGGGVWLVMSEMSFNGEGLRGPIG